MLRALWVVMLFTIASSAFADDENDQRFRNAVNAVSELGYTGAAAVVCELRSEDWGEDLGQNILDALGSLTQRLYSEPDQGPHFFRALQQLWRRLEDARHVTDSECAKLRYSAILRDADAIVGSSER
jgi:hypothetical protein